MTHGEQDVERVGRAMFIAECVFMGTANEQVAVGMWDTAPNDQGVKGYWRDLARAALAAMPAPSPVTSEVGVTVEQVEVAAAAMQQTLNTRGLSMGLMAISAFRSVGIPVAGEGAK